MIAYLDIFRIITVKDKKGGNMNIEMIKKEQSVQQEIDIEIERILNKCGKNHAMIKEENLRYLIYPSLKDFDIMDVNTGQEIKGAEKLDLLKRIK